MGPARHGRGDATILAPQCDDGERSDVQSGEVGFQRCFDGGEAVWVLDVDPPALGGQGAAVRQSLDAPARGQMPHAHVLALGPLLPDEVGEFGQGQPDGGGVLGQWVGPGAVVG